MNKLKELAYKQLQSGSNQINYREIVDYLRDTEGFFADDIVDKEDRTKLYINEAEPSLAAKKEENLTTESVQKIANEPPLVGFEDDGEERKRRWE